VSLLLNSKACFTALLAWFVFRENFDRRLVLGYVSDRLRRAILGWRPGEVGSPWPALAVAGACLCWALDNKPHAQDFRGDSVKIAGIKGLAAGTVNLCVAAAFGSALPALGIAAAAALVGLLGYGVSLALFVAALRQLGAARTAAYFSTAPFIGAAASFALLGEAPDASFWVASVLMAAGVALHLTERHRHLHRHDALTHIHPHTHDEHHRHEHDFAWDGAEPHSHTHEHDPSTTAMRTSGHPSSAQPLISYAPWRSRRSRSRPTPRLTCPRTTPRCSSDCRSDRGIRSLASCASCVPS